MEEFFKKEQEYLKKDQPKNEKADNLISPFNNYPWTRNNNQPSPITKLQEKPLFNPMEKTSTAKKLEFDQSKNIKKFMKEKETFGKVLNSPKPTKEWNFLKRNSLVRNNDENVFHPTGLETNELNFKYTLKVSIIFGLIVYMSTFFYHLYNSEPIVFCEKKKIRNGECVDGYLVNCPLRNYLH